MNASETRGEAGGEQKLAFDVLLRRDGHAGGDASKNGHDHRIVPLERGARAHRAGLRRVARDQASALQSLEMRVDGRGGRKADALADLTHRGRVAPLGGKGAYDV